jgi:hypothetical protein
MVRRCRGPIQAKGGAGSTHNADGRWPCRRAHLCRRGQRSRGPRRGMARVRLATGRCRKAAAPFAAILGNTQHKQTLPQRDPLLDDCGIKLHSLGRRPLSHEVATAHGFRPQLQVFVEPRRRQPRDEGLSIRPGPAIVLGGCDLEAEFEPRFCELPSTSRSIWAALRRASMGKRVLSER